MDIINVIGVIITIFFLWLCFEIWRAPMLRENEDGSWTTIKPANKLKDLFKKKK
jgi:hypothetical protein